DRRDDIPVLVQHFIRKYAADFDIENPTVAPDAIALLQAGSWSGNVRELENVVRRLLLSAGGPSINASAVREIITTRNAGAASSRSAFAAYATDLLARAQKGELTDAHAQMLA